MRKETIMDVRGEGGTVDVMGIKAIPKLREPLLLLALNIAQLIRDMIE